MVAMFGAAAATGIPRWRSIRCLAKVAACAELPLAQVTTTSGGRRVSRAISSASGAARLSAWQRTAAGASRNSAAMPAPDVFMPKNFLGRAWPSRHARQRLRGRARNLQRSFQCVAGTARPDATWSFQQESFARMVRSRQPAPNAAHQFRPAAPLVCRHAGPQARLIQRRPHRRERHSQRRAVQAIRSRVARRCRPSARCHADRCQTLPQARATTRSRRDGRRAPTARGVILRIRARRRCLHPRSASPSRRPGEFGPEPLPSRPCRCRQRSRRRLAGRGRRGRRHGRR